MDAMRSIDFLSFSTGTVLSQPLVEELWSLSTQMTNYANPAVAGYATALSSYLQSWLSCSRHGPSNKPFTLAGSEDLDSGSVSDSSFDVERIAVQGSFNTSPRLLLATSSHYLPLLQGPINLIGAAIDSML